MERIKKRMKKHGLQRMRKLFDLRKGRKKRKETGKIRMKKLWKSKKEKLEGDC